MKTSRNDYRNFIRAILVGASSNKGKPLYGILESELKAEDSRQKFYDIYVNIVEELERLVDPDNPDGYKYGEFLDSTELYCGAVLTSDYVNGLKKYLSDLVEREPNSKKKYTYFKKLTALEDESLDGYFW